MNPVFEVMVSERTPKHGCMRSSITGSFFNYPIKFLIMQIRSISVYMGNLK